MTEFFDAYDLKARLREKIKDNVNLRDSCKVAGNFLDSAMYEAVEIAFRKFLVEISEIDTFEF